MKCSLQKSNEQMQFVRCVIIFFVDGFVLIGTPGAFQECGSTDVTYQICTSTSFFSVCNGAFKTSQTTTKQWKHLRKIIDHAQNCIFTIFTNGNRNKIITIKVNYFHQLCVCLWALYVQCCFFLHFKLSVKYITSVIAHLLLNCNCH